MPPEGLPLAVHVGRVAAGVGGRDLHHEVQRVRNRGRQVEQLFPGLRPDMQSVFLFPGIPLGIGIQVLECRRQARRGAVEGRRVGERVPGVGEGAGERGGFQIVGGKTQGLAVSRVRADQLGRYVGRARIDRGRGVRRTALRLCARRREGQGEADGERRRPRTERAQPGARGAPAGERKDEAGQAGRPAGSARGTEGESRIAAGGAGPGRRRAPGLVRCLDCR